MLFKTNKIDKQEKVMYITKATEKLALLTNMFENRNKKIQDFLNEHDHNFILYAKELIKNNESSEITVYEVASIFLYIYILANEDKKKALNIIKKHEIISLYTIGRSFVTVYYKVLIEVSCKYLTLLKFRDNIDIKDDNMMCFGPAAVSIMPIQVALSYMDQIKEYQTKINNIHFKNKEKKFYTSLINEYYPFWIDDAIKINTDQVNSVVKSL